jgi:hypothetical protein
MKKTRQNKLDNQISKDTLSTIDMSMDNLSKGIVSEPVDLEELKQYVNEGQT